jgi:hypothetical protein
MIKDHDSQLSYKQSLNTPVGGRTCNPKGKRLSLMQDFPPLPPTHNIVTSSCQRAGLLPLDYNPFLPLNDYHNITSA